MILECVTVSVGYADYLVQTAPWNRSLFDRWLIVTSPDDKETRDVCKRYNLDCLVSEDHARDGSDFAKGRLVDRGLQHLRADGWRLHMDADIVLPATTRHALEIAHLDPDCIYGCDRAMIKSYEDWLDLLRSGYLHDQHDYHYRLRHPKGLEIGTRWVSLSQGYVPIGFWQLAHSSQMDYAGIRAKTYPLHHGSANRSDVQYGLQWDRRKRVLLPEIIAVHLESGPAKLGANWNGRTTKRFGPAAEKTEGVTYS